MPEKTLLDIIRSLAILDERGGFYDRNFNKFAEFTSGI